MIALLLLFTPPAEAACKTPFDNEQLHRLMTAGEDAYTYRKLAPLNRARADIQAGIPCLDEIVSPPMIAGYYRLQALSLYSSGTEEDVPLSHVHVGDSLRVRPGVKVPVDALPASRL